MKLMVASWNSGGADWNAEAEETELRTYTINHSFNRPAECVITLADPTGVLLRKYNAEANDVYLGSGKITLEDPTGTDIFYGRIISAVGTTENPRTLVLTCRDWMDQLDEEIITYDMREDLDGSGLRQSEAHADPDNALARLIDTAVKTLFSAQADDGGAFTDETEEANELTEDDMTLMPAAPLDDDAYYFGFESTISGMTLYISQRGAWVGTMAWEYWDGDSWESLTKTDPTNVRWTFEAAGSQTYAWTVPGDWAKNTINGVEAYYIRAVVDMTGPLTTQPLGRDCYAEHYMYDDDMSWDTTPGNPLNFDGMKLLFTAEMAGKRSWLFHPFKGTESAGAAYGDAREHLWVNNDDVDGGQDNVDWTLDYDFHVELGHNTPSDFYVDDSITGARIIARYLTASIGATNHSHLQIDDKTDGFISLETLDDADHYTLVRHELTAEEIAVLVDANGIATVRFDVDRTAGDAELGITYLAIEVDVETNGYASAISITETESNRLRVSTDLRAAATRIWEKTPYCIVRPIFKHIASDETPGGLIDDGDGIQAITATATIEHTSGLSARQYKDMTRLEILRDLAGQDKAHFWIALGSTILTYKSTFNDGAPTAMTDATATGGWRSTFDYSSMFNSYDVYGVRMGTYEVYQQSQNAASILKYRSTKTKTLRNAGVVSLSDALARGSALVARDKDVQQVLTCTIAGFDSTYRLGTEVSITSTYLGLTAAKYIVVSWSYNSQTPHNTTTLTLHPRISATGLQPIRDLRGQLGEIKEQGKASVADKFIADPITHEVT